MADLLAAWALLELLFALEALFNIALVAGGAWWLLRANPAPRPQGADAATDAAASVLPHPIAAD
jgi:hypothetical protein